MLAPVHALWHIFLCIYLMVISLKILIFFISNYFIYLPLWKFQPKQLYHFISKLFSEKGRKMLSMFPSSLWNYMLFFALLSVLCFLHLVYNTFKVTKTVRSSVKVLVKIQYSHILDNIIAFI